MPDDVLPDDLPDSADDRFYRRYLEACRRFGVEPVSADRVRALVGEWNRLLHAGESCTTKH